MLVGDFLVQFGMPSPKKKHYWTLMVFLGSLTSLVSARTTAINASSVLKNLLNPEFYDKRLRPNFGGKPVELSISLYLTSIGGLDAKEMHYTTTFFLRQNWNDDRLAYGDKLNATNISLGGDIMKEIWKPDTYINNEISSLAPDNMFLLRLFPNGNILYSQRMTVIASCMMDLRNFPMDKQKCFLLFESYGNTATDLTLSWTKKPFKDSVIIPSAVSISEFALDEYNADKITQTYTSGTFTQLELDFVIRRKKFHYVVQTYIPTILITILSWVSFWIPRSSPPARVALGITTVLALTTLIFGIQSSMPKVSYVKAIDWFLMTSFLFVFAALIEYPSSTFISFQVRKIGKTGTTIIRRVKGENAVSDKDFAMTIQSRRRFDSADSNQETEDTEHEDKERDQKSFQRPSPFGGAQNGILSKSRSQDYEGNGVRHRKLPTPPDAKTDQERSKENFTDSEESNIVDKYAKILFPLTYFLYNLAYWVVYLLEIDILT